MNKHIEASREYREAYGQEAHPEAGTMMLAGKPDTDEDALGRPGSYEPEMVQAAKEVPGVVKRCLDQQLGRGTPTGGKIGDATNHPNSGGEAKSEPTK